VDWPRNTWRAAAPSPGTAPPPRSTRKAAETSLENIANVDSKHASDKAQMSNAGVR